MSHASASVASNPPVQPPIARAIPRPQPLHGVTLDDDFHWHARQELARAVRLPWKPRMPTPPPSWRPPPSCRPKLYDEMLSHIQETDESVPYRLGDWFYSTRTVEAANIPSIADAPQPVPTSTRLRSIPARAGHPRRKRAGRGQSPSWTSEPWPSAPTATSSPTHRFHRLPPVYAAPARPAHARRPPRHSGARRIAGLGRRLAQPSSTPPRTRPPSARTASCATRSALPPPKDNLVFHEEDERFNLGVSRTRDGLYLNDRVRQPQPPTSSAFSPPTNHKQTFVHRSTRGRTGVLPGPSGRSLHHPQATTRARTSASSPRRRRARPRPLAGVDPARCRQTRWRTSTSSSASPSPLAANSACPRWKSCAH